MTSLGGFAGNRKRFELVEGLQEIVVRSCAALHAQNLVDTGWTDGLVLIDKLLVELFAGTDAREFDRNVAIRHETRQPDEIARHINDSNRFAHVQYEQGRRIVD